MAAVPNPSQGESQRWSGRLTVRLRLRDEVRGLARNHLGGRAQGRRLLRSCARLLERHVDLFVCQPWGGRAQGAGECRRHCPPRPQRLPWEKPVEHRRPSILGSCLPISDSLEPLSAAI